MDALELSDKFKEELESYSIELEIYENFQKKLLLSKSENKKEKK